MKLLESFYLFYFVHFHFILSYNRSSHSIIWNAMEWQQLTVDAKVGWNRYTQNTLKWKTLKIVVAHSDIVSCHKIISSDLYGMRTEKQQESSTTIHFLGTILFHSIWNWCISLFRWLFHTCHIANTMIHV